MRIFFIPPNRKMFQKRGQLFLFFEIVTAEFSHFLCHKKVTQFCSKKWKKWPLFLEHFFGWGGGVKKHSHILQALQKNRIYHLPYAVSTITQNLNSLF